MSDSEMRPIAYLISDKDGARQLCFAEHVDPMRMIAVTVTPLVPAITDEQVREIAEKWALAWQINNGVSIISCIEAAIREAIGRGERG